MRIAFSTSNLLRKERFRIITSVYEKNKKLFVKKRAVNKYAYSHLAKSISAEAELRKNAPNLNFVKVIRKQKAEIVYEYLEMPTLLQLMEKALIGKEFDEVLEFVRLGLKAIDEVNSKEFNIYSEQKFVDLFDRKKDFKNDYLEDCLAIGILDLKFDNLLKDSGQLYLIDYEWVFDFPLPRQFIKFRAIYYLAVSLQLIIDTLCSEDFPCIKLSENVLIPKSWMDLIDLKQEDLNRFLFYENSFQNYVNVLEQKVDPNSVKNLNHISTSPLQEDLNSLSNENSKAANKKIVKIFMMEQQIAKLQKELLNKNHELESIKGSKIFKLWRKYHDVKSQVKG